MSLQVVNLSEFQARFPTPAARKARYARYLAGDGWKLVREACKRRDGYRCRDCGTKGNRFNALQAHHTDYTEFRRTGRTPLKDLRTLCDRCHRRRHDLPQQLNIRSLATLVGLALVAVAILRTCGVF